MENLAGSFVDDIAGWGQENMIFGSVILVKYNDYYEDEQRIDIVYLISS